MPAFQDNPKIFQTFFESLKGGVKLGVKCVGDLNRLINKKDSHDLVQYVAMAETLQDRKLAEVATRIIEKEDAHLVLIAGPSSSAKTTFALKLCVQLRVLGKAPLCVSLDDFYVDRAKTPKDAKGEYDYECLEALNIECINKTFQGLINGERVRMPRYNFLAGLSEWGDEMQLEENGIIVVEGIHGLNDNLTKLINPENKFRIFISALTQINIDDHNRIPTTDNRLLRRIVRDYQYRGYSAEDTIVRWPSVRAGEEAHIFPFQNNADFVYNSALDYEISTLKVIAEPLLRRIKPDNEKAYNEAVRLLAILANFLPLAEKYVPTLSLLREFIGGSPFHDKV